MGLIGRKVKHYKFGEGAITQQDTSYVTVKFMTEAAPKKISISALLHMLRFYRKKV